MNLSILIFSGIVWSFAEFLLFNVFLPRTEKVFFQVMFFVAFLMGMFIGAWLIFNLGRNLYKSVEVLLQKTPDNFDVDEFKTQILSIEGVKNIDDFHIWSLDGIDSVMTLKVNVDFEKNVEEIKHEIYSISNEYHVVDITIELD